MDNHSTEEKTSKHERSSESASESSSESQLSQASERFLNELNIESSRPAAGQIEGLQRTREENGVEHANGQVHALSFDDSIFAGHTQTGRAHATDIQNNVTAKEISASTDSLGNSGTIAERGLAPRAEQGEKTGTQHDGGHAPESPTRRSETTTTDSHGNVTTVDAQGNTTVTSRDGNMVTYTGADGRGWIRVHSDRGFTQTHFGPSPRDNYSIERTYGRDGAYSDRYTYADSSRNHTREVDREGRVVVTDATGLRIRLDGGSPEFQERVLNQILDLPLADRQRLRSLGATVHVVDRPSDANIRRRIPEGAQGFYDHIDTRAIIIGERSGRGLETSDPEWLTRHEIGHALDHSFGSPFSRTALSADSNAFRDALKEDELKMDDLTRAVYDRYFNISPFTHGPAELFADIYAAMQSANPTARERELLAAFPSLAAQIRRRLGPR
ncbi:MAG: hypothetical protein K2X77_24800 [Candidatus Obscuribacterales bacterium]|nr:hypothetical protein [Candidatus Obscuribacterales bacterium]